MKPETVTHKSGVVVAYDEEGEPTVENFGEPWSRSAEGANLFIGPSGGDNTRGYRQTLLEICEVGYGGDEFADLIHPLIDDEECAEEVNDQIAAQFAERIRLCVNACKGISNEMLAVGVVAKENHQ